MLRLQSSEQSGTLQLLVGLIERQLLAIQELIIFLSAFQVIPSCTTRLSELQTGLLPSFQFSLAELLLYDGMASSLSSINKSLVDTSPSLRLDSILSPRHI